MYLSDGENVYHIWEVGVDVYVPVLYDVSLIYSLECTSFLLQDITFNIYFVLSLNQ